MSIDDMIEFVTACLDEEAWWAREVSRNGERYTDTGEHWRWESESGDEPVAVDPVAERYLQGYDGASVGLRSVERYRASLGPLPHLIIQDQYQVETVVAGYIARHDPARELRKVAAGRKTIDRYVEARIRSRQLRDEYQASVAAGVPAVSKLAEAQQLDSICVTLAGPVRDVTSGYDNHPGYQEQWRP